MTTSRAPRPYGQYFDEVRFVTVPRYKTSEASGDEWRISGKVQFMNKGVVLYEKRMGSIEGAVCSDMPADIWDEAIGHSSLITQGDICDQEGCSEDATHTYKVKKTFEINHFDWDGKTAPAGLFRMFCDRHATRGDCALDDAEDNYEILQGEDPQGPRTSDLSPSGAIVVSEENLGDLLSRALEWH